MRRGLCLVDVRSKSAMRDLVIRLAIAVRDMQGLQLKTAFTTIYDIQDDHEHERSKVYYI